MRAVSKIRENYKFHPEIFLLSQENLSRINGFHCNVEAMDNYLKSYAITDAETGNGVTYLVIDKDLNELVAYYTLCSSAVFVNGEMSSAVYINMFAVRGDYQDIVYYTENKHQEICVSASILYELIGNVYNMSKNILGVKYISLYSLPEACEFYKRNFFIELTDEIMMPDSTDKSISIEECIPMVMPLFS